jgi:hypothetical protein
MKAQRRKAVTRTATPARRLPPILSHRQATKVAMRMSNPGREWARRLPQLKPST